MKMILQAKLEMPHELSKNAQGLLRQLFRRDPTRRLGAQSSDEIKNHVFFAEIDWAKLETKSINPPFKPTLKSELDTSHFDDEFTGQVPTDTPGIPQSANTQSIFKGFSFSAPSPTTDTMDISSALSQSQTRLYPKIKTIAITDEYIIGDEIIGHNTFEETFCECRKATHKASRRDYCVKIIDMSKRVPGEEIEILYRHSGHPNIISYVEVFEDATHAYLVTELLTGDELLDVIFQKGHIGEAGAKAIMLKLCEVVEYLHGNGVVHRDLKPSNIAYAEKPGTPASIRVTDFAFAKQLTAENGMLMTPCFTANFVAPEVLKRQGYDKGCDMWSLGILLYTLLSGYPPFASNATDKPQDILDRIENGTVTFEAAAWSQVSVEAQRFITGLLHKSPELRTTASQALQDEWFRTATAAAPGGAVVPQAPVEGARAAVENTLKAFQSGHESSVALAPVKLSSLASRRRGKKPSMIMEVHEDPS